MKVSLMIFVFLCTGQFMISEAYTTKYDNINLDDILQNQRLYKNYFNCLTGRGRCTPDGKELKDILPEALATACEKCTEKQKKGTEKVISFLINNKPNDYKVLERMFDPTGIYRRKYKEKTKIFGAHI